MKSKNLKSLKLNKIKVTRLSNMQKTKLYGGSHLNCNSDDTGDGNGGHPITYAAVGGGNCHVLQAL